MVLLTGRSQGCRGRKLSTLGATGARVSGSLLTENAEDAVQGVLAAGCAQFPASTKHPWVPVLLSEESWGCVAVVCGHPTSTVDVLHW